MTQKKFESKIRWQIVYAIGFWLSGAAVPIMLAFFKPSSEPSDTWFSRCGAVMTVLGIFSQITASDLAEMIRGGTFSESHSMYRRYRIPQRVIFILAVALVVAGTVIWGYGDLLFRFYDHRNLLP